MERIGLRWAAFILALVAAGSIEQAAAAEVTLLSTLAAHSVVEKVRSGFEQKTSHHLVVKFDTAAGLKRDIESGIKFDAFLLTKDASTALEGAGKLPRGSSRSFAVVFLGLAAKEGSSIPDISTSAKLLAVLLGAQRISYAREGASGQSFMRSLEAHAMIEPLAQKLVPMPASATIEAVAAGDVTYGVQLISEIVAVKGATLVGPLPAEYQSSTRLTMGCASDPCAPAPAALIEFLSSHEAADAIAAAGMVVPQQQSWSPDQMLKPVTK
jgi:molybdate transport system substrate-binding protein